MKLLLSTLIGPPFPVDGGDGINACCGLGSSSPPFPPQRLWIELRARAGKEGDSGQALAWWEISSLGH